MKSTLLKLAVSFQTLARNYGSNGTRNSDMVYLVLNEVADAIEEVANESEVEQTTTEAPFLKALCELLMCADPFPASEDSSRELNEQADKMAKDLGFINWIDAYHKL